MIATINVTSATSGGRATKAHIPDTGGLNITGRMAELDYLFSEADLDIIGVQGSRLPQTQILQTRDYTVFNSGASRVSITTAYSCGSGNGTEKP